MWATVVSADDGMLLIPCYIWLLPAAPRTEVHVTRTKFHIFFHFGDQRFLDGISVSPELEFRMPGSFYAFRMKSKEIRYYYFF